MAYLDNSGDWGNRLAPTLAELESLARLSFSHLPEKLRRFSRNIELCVADFPEDSLMEDMGLESPFELLSLFEGPGPGSRFSLAAGQQPASRVLLFRRPILDYWAENEETLDEILVYLLLQELGRPFGLSDEDMAALTDAA
ncbi:MAG: Zn-dependent protease [Candidatus Tokpelaia sp.]|uniref:metallopeptidase family protein n=1 Tax=Candidatus Tokpelaia sp. TaxID=2233777 RepID=UPI001238E504|nr:metallopeptidase family protein [Candidatus Tokpelaia sp.]KAA6204927.1 MAG: Zn-dependent protease [Candidatus Tokpelaia sp.]KAA6207094.1 MAG: Zn-dependent protease [Candidatus Tokpelaia sp.]KAA6405368.1 Zn-dependent protease [Candidatus Tokpelaia sp.]